MAARRRREIRGLRDRGLSINQIADLLGVATKTVRTHLRAPSASQAR
jgi:DNA-binding NarL/FixJ family response regulator